MLSSLVKHLKTKRNLNMQYQKINFFMSRQKFRENIEDTITTVLVEFFRFKTAAFRTISIFSFQTVTAKTSYCKTTFFRDKIPLNFNQSKQKHAQDIPPN